MYRAFIIHTCLPEDRKKMRRAEARLEEACGLALAINLKVTEKEIVNLKAINPGTFLGKGKVAEFADIIKAKEIDLVILDNHLSPLQQRNLEKALGAKVIDRTALILEIFGERARTKEGTLQVELAALEYQKSRLVRSWTHLERQRGGFGFMGGPGERQIEADRRQINERITKIKKQLKIVKRTRTLHRKSRASVPYPVVALVGYTNAGKSTLFNQLTGAKVMAEDALFATLDPTMRVVTLPSKHKVILSDTVGFISDLPTELVASFHATLEEVLEADIILHVRDISSPNAKAEKQDVEEVLESLGVANLEFKTLEVLNKIDLLPSLSSRPSSGALAKDDGGDFATEKSSTLSSRGGDFAEAKSVSTGSIEISALTGKGCNRLLKEIDKHMTRKHEVVNIRIKAADGKLIAWLHSHGDVRSKKNKGDMVHITVGLSQKDAARLSKLS